MSANKPHKHNAACNGFRQEECHDHRHDHAHCHCHCHSHNHGDSHAAGEHSGVSGFLRPAVSALFLISGIILNHSNAGWFANPSVNLIWFIAAFLPVGLPVIKEGWEAIRQKDVFNEFTLMIVACIGAFCIGEYPEAAGVMLFYTIGEMLQDRAVGKATRNISRLLDVRPEQTTVFRNGQTFTESPQNVKTGETIEIKPGERVPLDGTLLDSEAVFDTSALTGESMPRSIGPDGEVLAGMIPKSRPVKIKVSRPYGDSALARILKLVKEASGRKAPTEKFIRKFSRIYTPAVMLAALLILIIPAIAGAVSSFNYVFSEWLYRSLVFLVISCPCALVISVPLGYFAGIGAASRCGILFKGGNYLDAITKIDAIAFDKTGTLTTGTFEVTQTEYVGISPDRLLSIIYSAELKSTHPIAVAIQKHARENNAIQIATDHLSELSGRGMTATMDGDDVIVGNLRLLSEKGITFPDHLKETTATIVACAVNGKYAGALFLSDKIKDDSIAAIDRLKKLGIRNICLLSGDKKEVVEEYAGKLGVDNAFGELLPEDKAAYIEKLTDKQHHKAAFVGDGMNDAPVLALSSVGIAMGGLGSDAAVESADIVIQDDKPSKIVTAIKIGRTTKAIVMENIIGAIAIKIIVLIAGATGHTTLWAAVFADVGVALLAVLNALRILYKKYE